MKIRMLAAVAITFVTIGCGVPDVYFSGTIDAEDDGHVIVSHPYINTYVQAPQSVLDLIAYRVEGYFSPQISRYDDYLYPSDIAYDSYDLPCFVRSDYNGDGYNDYAFLFSKQEWEYGTWYLTTKLVVVLSTRSGWTVGADMVLGTVSGSAGTPIEEYWSIYRVLAGQHTVVTYKNGVKVTKSVHLYDDGFFLASLDPNEEALFYAEYGSVYETDMSGGLAKKQAITTNATDEKRIIPFNKNVENRVRAVK